MRLCSLPKSSAWLVAAGLLMAPEPSFAEGVSSGPKPTADYQAKAEQYARARRAFEEEAGAYWKSIAEKRRVRNAKRRNNEPIELDDYVLTQPPVYQGPPRPVDPTSPDPDPTEPRKPDIPVVADFLKAAAEQFRFVPQRPESEIAFKRAYVKVGVGRRPDQGSGRSDLCLRDRRQRHLRRAGRIDASQAGRARDLAGGRLQPASEHQ